MVKLTLNCWTEAMATRLARDMRIAEVGIILIDEELEPVVLTLKAETTLLPDVYDPGACLR